MCGKLDFLAMRSLALAVLFASTSAVAAEPIPWIHDDFAGALARAKAEKKPLVVDTWAPWCHSCLSMQHFVFTDPSLAPLAGRFVWLALDTEKPTAADFLATYTVEVWPTFYVLDPADASVAGRYLGSMSIGQLRTFLDDSERAVQLGHKMKPGDPLALLRAADQARLAGHADEARKLYAAARAKAPAGWPRLPEAVEGEMMALRELKDWGGCVDLGLATLDKTGNGPNAADSADIALGCAENLPAGDARVDKLRHRALDRLLALVNDARAPLAADDRGDMWRMIQGVREDLHDAAGAREAARARLALLDDAAARAPDAQAASTFDWARAQSLLDLDRGPEAVRLLEKSEAALPDDYNPPARLARVHYTMKAYGEALAAVDRALVRAYGPRKGGIYLLKADILDKQGRRDEARKVVEEDIAYLEALPGKDPRAVAAAKKKLETLR
jgi:tetratricopeptide (TPR) repeat protein